MLMHRWCVALVGLTLAAGGSGYSAAGALASPPESPFVVEAWTPEDGLPQSSVISVIQSRDGYLWLGTLNGLVRFDGVRFTVFDEVNTPGLPSSRIVHLFEDSRGGLWVGTETGGVVLIRDGQARPLEIGRGSREGRLLAACEDASGAVWLYTADGQLCRYLDGKVDVWQFGNERPTLCRALAAEPERLWVGMDWQMVAIGPLEAVRPPELPRELVLPLGRLDGLLASARSGHWRLMNGRVLRCRGNTLERDLGTYPWRANARPSAACEDRDGNLIVGTLDETSGDGVFWFGPTGLVARISAAEGLSRNGVLSLCMDREGNLWVGTDGGGLNRVRRKRFERLVISKGAVAQTVCPDTRGGLWMGFTRGAAYQRGDTVREFGPSEGLASDYEQNVSAVFVDRDEQVWLGTGGGLFRWTGQRFERVVGPAALHTAISAIHQDRQGRLWFGTRAGLVGRDRETWSWWNTRNGLSSDQVLALADDAEGTLWIGTLGGGLNRLQDGRLTVLRQQADALPSDEVACLWVDGDGVLWVGTQGSGLARLAGTRWTRFTTRDGLISNSIAHLLDDGAGSLWVGSNRGLMRLDKASLTAFAEGRTNGIVCRAYGRADGLPSSECTFGSQPAATRAPDGRLWFATVLGLVCVRPADLQPNLSPPPVVIESVALEGQPAGPTGVRATPPDQFTIPPRKGRLEIRYTSLNLTAPERARFQYRLAGQEQDWTDAGAGRVARYPKLPPGRYTFEVRAANEDGVWSERPATLALVVQPPFWQTSGFITLTALSLLGLVAGTVHLVSTSRLKRQLRQQQALEKERARIARDLHDQLGANLTQVALLGELVEADRAMPDEVAAHASQISQTARETTRALDEIVWATNPANDTLEGLVNYVCKYAQEYLALAGLRYRLDVPSPLPPIPLLPEVRHNVFLAAKEAVNNVVKHARANAARVRLRLQPGRCMLEIQDDGRGLPPDAATSPRNGLKNMRKRLADVGGTCAVEPAPDGGTVVRLTFPVAHSRS